MRGQRARIKLGACLPVSAQVQLETLPGVAAQKAPYLRRSATSPDTPDPGPFVPGWHVDIPMDALVPLLDRFRTFGITIQEMVVYVRSGLVQNPARIRSLQELPDLTPEAKEAAYPYQSTGFSFFQELGGGMAHWDCGTGKTFLGAAYAAGDPGAPFIPINADASRTAAPRRVVIITLATTVYQWDSAMSGVFLPGRMPRHVIDTESSYIARPTKLPGKAYRPCLETADGAPLLDPVQSWVKAYPARQRWYVPTTFPESDKGVQPGDILTRAQVKKLTGGSTEGLISSAVEEDLSLLGEWLSSPQEDSMTLSTEQRSKLAKAGLVEVYQPGRSSRWQTVNREGEVVRSFTGSEPVFLTPGEQTLHRSRIMAKSPGWEESQVLVQAETTAPRTEEEANIRAKYLAIQWAASLSGTCNLDPEVEVCILSWQILPYRRRFLLDWQPTTIILDESQNAKSKDIWTTEADNMGGSSFVYAETIAASAHMLTETCPRVLLLTATPAPNRVKDWWGQLQILTKGWGKYRIFADHYCGGHEEQINPQVTVYNDKGESNTTEFNLRKDRYLHRVTYEEAKAYIVPVTREIIRIPQEKLSAVKVSAAEWKAAKERGASGVQELQILMAAASKRPFIVDRAVEHFASNLKVVIFTGRILDCEQLYADLHKRVPNIDGWCIHGENLPALGGTSYIPKLMELWRDHTGPCFLVGTEEVWGVGVDGLQFSHRALRARLPITPLQWQQVEGRFERGSMKGTPPNTTVEYFWGEGSYDDRVMSLFEDKMGSVSLTYGVFKARMDAVIAQFRGVSSEAELFEQIATRLTAGIPSAVLARYAAELDDDDD